MLRSLVRNTAMFFIAVLATYSSDLRAQPAESRFKNADAKPLIADYVLPAQLNGRDSAPKDSPKADDKTDGANGKAERPRTLLSWNLFKDDKADDKDDEKNGGANNPRPLATDRPDFTENSATVGLGVIQVEAGWTFTWDRFEGATKQTHTYPELLVRAGLFAEWFELRIGQNWRTERSTNTGVVTKVAGADDIYLGGRFMLTEQQKILPEQSITFQMTVPSGSRAVSDKRILPGFNYTYSWEVNEFFGIGGSSGMNAAVDSDGTDRPYTEWFTSLTTGFTLTKKLSSFAEVYALMPHGARGPDIVAQYYFDTGFQYLMTENLAFDVRIGVGLNRHSDDFFVGSGLVFRR